MCSSGKSTQVPAFILEDQLSRGRPCRIYCTEPRRISAISLAQRLHHPVDLSDNILTYSTQVYLVSLEMLRTLSALPIRSLGTRSVWKAVSRGIPGWPLLQMVLRSEC